MRETRYTATTLPFRRRIGIVTMSRSDNPQGQVSRRQALTERQRAVIAVCNDAMIICARPHEHDVFFHGKDLPFPFMCLTRIDGRQDYKIVILFRNRCGFAEPFFDYHLYPQFWHWNCERAVLDSMPNMNAPVALLAIEIVLIFGEPQVGHFGMFTIVRFSAAFAILFS